MGVRGDAVILSVITTRRRSATSDYTGLASPRELAKKGERKEGVGATGKREKEKEEVEQIERRIAQSQASGVYKWRERIEPFKE